MFFLRYHPTAAQTATASFVTSEDVLPQLNPLPWAGTILHQHFLIFSSEKDMKTKIFLFVALSMGFTFQEAEPKCSGSQVCGNLVKGFNNSLNLI